MFVIMTFFEHQQVCAETTLCGSGDPIGVAPLFHGRSAFERNLIALCELGMTRLHILTDSMAEQIARSRVYQNCARSIECCVETVDELRGDWGGERFVQLVDEAQAPALWVRGDVVADESILKAAIRYKGNCFIKTYSGTVVKQLDRDPVEAESFLQEVMFAHQAADGTTVLPVVKLYSRRVLHQIEDASDRRIIEFEKQQFVPVVCSCYFAFSMTTLEAQELPGRVSLHNAIQQRVYDVKDGFEMLAAWLSQLDKSRLLLITSGELTQSQKDVISALEGAAIVDLNTEEETGAHTRRANETEYIIVCGGEKAIRFARRLESALDDEAVPRMVFVTDAHSLCASAEIVADGGDCATGRPAKIFVDFERTLSESDRLLLCSHIWSSSICGILSASKLPSQCWMYNILLMRFSKAKKIAEWNLLNIAALVRGMEQLGTNLYLRAMAARLCEETGWPYPHALLCVCGCVAGYLRRDMRNIKVLGGRRVLLADALDEIMIGFRVSARHELLDVVQTFLYQTGIELDGERLARAINSDRAGGALPSNADSIFELSRAQIDAAFRAPETRALACELRKSGRPGEPLSNYDVYRKAGQLRKDAVCERMEAIRRQIMLKIADRLKQMDIPFWLIWDRYDERLLMMPWDIESMLPALEESMEELCFARNICSDPARYSDVFVYLKGTRCVSEWNINASTPHKGIGIAIQSVVPLEHFTQTRLKLAETIDRILLNRRGYRGFGFSNKQMAAMVLFAPVSSKRMQSIRNWMLKLPGRDCGAWNEPAVCELRQRSTFPVDLKDAKTVDVEGRTISVIDASGFAPRGLPKAPCYVCFGKEETYMLSEPKLKQASVTPKQAMGVLAKKSLRKLRGLPRDIRGGTVKEAKKARRWCAANLIAPMRVRGKRALTQLQGTRRRLGLFLTPAEQELRKLGGLYKGKRCFLVGNGPSLKAEDLDMIRDEISFGCNFVHKIYAQTQWRPTYHFISDSSTVRTACWDIVQNQDSERTTMVIRDFAYQNMSIKPKKAIVAPSISMDEYYVSDNFLAYHYISHATVMSMMLEAAMYMGFSEIYLIGVDATTSSDKGGNFAANYFTPEQRAKLNALKKKAIKNYDVAARRREIAERQRMVYRKIRESAEARGIHIYNATRGGELEVFDRVNLDEVVKERKA